MEQSSDTNYMAFEVTIAGDDVKFSASRDRGTSQVNGIYHPSLISIKANSTPEEILPWYSGNNNEPEYLMTLISNNPTLLGLILTKCTILHGQGLTLFRKEGKEKVAIDFEEWPEAIRDFYEYNDLNNLTYQAFCDFEMLGNFFHGMIFSNGSSNNNKEVVEINRMYPETVRAFRPMDGHGRISQYAISAMWEDRNGIPDPRRVKAYFHRDFFDRESRKFQPNGGQHTAVMWHGKRRISGFPHYSIPHWYGARFHVELQNEIPRWHISNIVNMWGGRMAIYVNEAYINRLRNEINPDTKVKFTTDEIKETIAKMVRDLFHNPINVGKSLLSGYVSDHQGKPIKDIIIEPIKLDVKDDAYVSLEGPINNKITSSVGVQAALASLITDKGMSSGSEMTQAWNIECAKAIMTQNLILEPIRFIHRYNGWDPGLSWGFENPSLVTKDIEKSGMIQDAQTPEVPQPTQ